MGSQMGGQNTWNGTLSIVRPVFQEFASSSIQFKFIFIALLTTTLSLGALQSQKPRA